MKTKLFGLVFAIAMSFVFVACPDPEPLDPAEKLTTKPLLSSVTMNYTYGDGGNSESLEYQYIYKNNKLSTYFFGWDCYPMPSFDMTKEVWSFSNDDYTVEYSNICRNSFGYITSFDYHVGGRDVENSHFGFTYNSNGTLSSINGQGYKYGEPASVTANLYWNNNNLTEVLFTHDDAESKSKYTTKFEYSEEKNPQKVLTYCQARAILDASIDELEMLCGLALVGNFGVGSVNLPNRFTETQQHNAQAPYTSDPNNLYFTTDKNSIIKEKIVEIGRFSTYTEEIKYIYN